VDGLEKILQAKVTCNTRSKKRRPKSVEISKRNSTSKIERRSTSSPLILRRSFLKQREVMFNIDGMRSAFKSTC
jgi:hypothetical protein